MLSRLNLKLNCILLSFFLVTPANADKWYFEKEATDKDYQFGDTTITLSIDATVNQQFPDFIIDVKAKEILLARYKNVAFEQVFAAEDNSVFVGLSNDGLPGTAIVVFDNKGNLRLEVKHRFANLDYCSQSEFRQRIWFDGVNPAFEFKFDEKQSLQDMFVNDCKGQRISLFTLIDNIYKRDLSEK